MAKTTGSKTRVVVVVFDGLRPDLVGPATTPNILRVARGGTWFAQARSVFPSVTRVATTSIATGAPPSVHGVVGNAFYFADAFADKVFDTGKRADIDRGETATGGAFVASKTFGDQMHMAGLKLMVVHTGSAGATHCINPRAARHGHWTFCVNGAASTPTPHAVAECVERFGPLPPKELPKLQDQDYATRVMVEHVLPQKPDVALVWFNEPDTSFHYLNIGSDGAFTALKNADCGLGRILDWVEAQPDAEQIAVIVASDHGQIATSGAVPLFDEAGAAGFAIGRGASLGGADFVATGGSSGGIWQRTRDQAALERLALWLMEHPAVSHVLSRASDPASNAVEGAIAGTLALSCLGQGHARSADLMYILKSTLARDAYGLPGVGLLMPADVAVGGGYHGGINPYELTTVLIVSAPHRFRAGLKVEEPGSITDIAPTILDLLGVPAAPSMQGRALAKPARTATTERVFEAGRGTFRQRIVCLEQDGRSIIQHGGQGL